MSTRNALSAVAIAAGAFCAVSMPAAAQEKASKEIVKRIIDVKLAEQESAPPNLVVTATGQVPTSGWQNAVLVRVVYDKPPADGIQDYILFADRPTGIVAQVISRVTAENTWKSHAKAAPWLKGVRVHGVDRGAVVKMLK